MPDQKEGRMRQAYPNQGGEKTNNDLIHRARCLLLHVPRKEQYFGQLLCHSGVVQSRIIHPNADLMDILITLYVIGDPSIGL